MIQIVVLYLVVGYHLSFVDLWWIQMQHFCKVQ